MNLLLLLPEDQGPTGDYEVSGPRAEHLLTVLGAKRGQLLHVGFRNGRRGRADVVAIDFEHKTLRLRVQWGSEAPPPPSTRLILAVPRPKVLRRLVPQVVGFGLREIVLLRTWRVQRSYLEADALEPNGLRALAHEGMMQACLTYEPVIRFEPKFLPYVEGELEGEAAAGVRLIAHPRAATHLGRSSVGHKQSVSIAVGPEAGFLDEEVESFRRAGFVPVRVTDGILKVETACIAALAQLDALRNGGAVV